MRSELEKYGIQMPAFSKIGGILANELSVDEAACKRKCFILFWLVGPNETGKEQSGIVLISNVKCVNIPRAFKASSKALVAYRALLWASRAICSVPKCSLPGQRAGAMAALPRA